MKICSAVSELLHASGRTDGTVLMRSPQKAKAPNKRA